MRSFLIGVLVTASAAAAIEVPRTSFAQSGRTGAPTADLLEWPLPPGEQSYARIDGRHMHQYVEEQAAISRRYRDNGHPQFWGRIIGTSADAENAEWLMQKFRQLGLTDVHEQYFDLPPQWMPQSWTVTLSADGKTLSVDTAQPTYQAVGTPPGGLDLEAAYVGMASEADLKLAKDVRGKAVFFYST